MLPLPSVAPGVALPPVPKMRLLPPSPCATDGAEASLLEHALETASTPHKPVAIERHIAVKSGGSVELHGEAVLMVRFDVHDVPRRACAVLRGRRAQALPFGLDVDLPIRRACATVAGGGGRRIRRWGDATSLGANETSRTIRTGAARLDACRARIAGAEVDARFAGVTARFVLIAVVHHHLEAIVVAGRELHIP